MAPKIFGRGRAAPPATPARSSHPYQERLEEYDEDIQEYPTPNERLTQAIQYLTNENIHSSRQFERCLDLIERFILKRYPAEGLSFSSRLYNQLKAQAEGHKRQISDLERAEPVAAYSETFIGSSDSESSGIEEVGPYRGLTRTPERFAAVQRRPSKRAQAATHTRTMGQSTKSPVAKQTPVQGRPSGRLPATGGRHEDVGPRTKLWDYGASAEVKNEEEVWHADMPALLPFGETIHMARWESDWIDADLRQNVARSRAEKTAKDKGKGRADERRESGSTKLDDEMIKTHVNPPPVKALNNYESGSRFTLPPPALEIKTLIQESRSFNIEKARKRFNKELDNTGELVDDLPPRHIPKLAGASRVTITPLPEKVTSRRASAASASGTKRRRSSNLGQRMATHLSKKPRTGSAAAETDTQTRRQPARNV